jgi:hypothetical protein
VTLAENGTWDGDEFTAVTDHDLNFIAVRNPTTGDILLLVVNDSEDAIGQNSWIFFSSETEGDYPDRTCWGGFNPFDYIGPGPGSSDDMGVNFVGMPPFTASLLELED